MGDKAANRQFLVHVDGIPGERKYWATKSGGEVTASSNKVWDGGSLVPGVLASPAEVGDVVVARPFDPDLDHELATQLLRRVGQWRTVISVQPTYGDLGAARVKPRVYTDALLTGVREPEPDASSGDAADWELTFTVGSVS